VPHKLLVANRGEIACRIIQAAQKLGVPTVAVYSDVDEAAPHVAMADEKRRLGPARAQDSYLNQDAVFLAARETESTLIHPGYGFLAENSGFAARCGREGFVFVGPSSDTIAAMAEVDAVMEQAKSAGATIVKSAQDTFWGGYAGYFQDPDQHLWEVAWNPYFPLSADGALTVPP